MDKHTEEEILRIKDEIIDGIMSTSKTDKEKLSGNEGYVYRITCKINGRRYIGQTEDIKARFEYHKCMLRKGNHPCHEMQYDYNTYGEKNFHYEVIKECDKKLLKYYEYFYINHESTISFVYNKNKGVNTDNLKTIKRLLDNYSAEIGERNSLHIYYKEFVKELEIKMNSLEIDAKMVKLTDKDSIFIKSIQYLGDLYLKSNSYIPVLEVESNKLTKQKVKEELPAILNEVNINIYNKLIKSLKSYIKKINPYITVLSQDNEKVLDDIKLFLDKDNDKVIGTINLKFKMQPFEDCIGNSIIKFSL